MHGKNKPMGRGKGILVDADGSEIDVKKLLKDIEFLGTSRMTWKERKELENRKVVSLGGKPPKKHRIPLSVAKVSMKKQKDKKVEDPILGRFGERSAGNSSRTPDRRKAEDRVLKSSEGHFSKGVLDVKHLLQHDKSSNNKPRGGNDGSALAFGEGSKKKGNKSKGKKNKRKKGGKKRR